MKDELHFKIADADSYNPLVNHFDRYTERYTSYLLASLLEKVTVTGDGSVLDVGTGTGVVALAMARRMNAQGQVVGVDLSDGMLRGASAKVMEPGGTSAVFVKMDAENLAFHDDSFDAVLSLYALRHFPNPARSVREILRVLKPGGRIVVAVGSGPPLFSMDGAAAITRRVADIWDRARGRQLMACGHIDGLVEEYLPERENCEHTDWSKRHVGFSGTLKELVVRAGFEQVSSSWEGRRFVVESPEDFWQLQLTFSSIARKRIALADKMLRKRIKKDFYEQCERVLERKGQLVYPTGAVLVSATKPSM